VKQQKDVKQPLSLSVGLIEKLLRSNVEPTERQKGLQLRDVRQLLKLNVKPIERLWRHNVKPIKKKPKQTGSKSWSFVS
jgi:hypothetical protein